MFPVCGKPGIGTAAALILIVGAADAWAASTASTAPMSSTHLDAVRIMLASILQTPSHTSPRGVPVARIARDLRANVERARPTLLSHTTECERRASALAGERQQQVRGVLRVVQDRDRPAELLAEIGKRRHRRERV